MPETPLSPGTRVQVLRDPDYGPGPWPAEPIGTVAVAADATAFSWITTTRGLQLQYWIVFDEPQFDAEGDGPYAASEVLACYLKAL